MTNRRTRLGVRGLAASLVASLMIVGGLLAGLAGAAPAQAAELSGAVFEIRSQISDNALSVAGTTVSSGSRLQTNAFDGAYGQYWKVEPSGEHYTIRNSLTGLALAVTDGGVLQMASATSAAGQLWDLADNGDGQYTISSALDGRALDVANASPEEGTAVQVYEPNGTVAQRWSVVPVSQVLEDGVYTIATSLDGTRVLDVSNASQDNFAPVQLWSANGTSAQKWSVAFDASTGLYKVVSVNSTKSLDIPNADAGMGVLLQQYEQNGTAAQLWSLLAREDGTVEIRSSLSGLALDVPNAVAQDGARVQMWDPNGSAAQCWSFTRTSLGISGVNRIESSLSESSVVELRNSSAQVWRPSASLSQKWEFSEVERDVFSIMNVSTGGYLSDRGAGLVASGFDESASLWKAKVGRGGLVFTNVSTGLALDLSGAVTSEGTAVSTYAPNGTGAQAWKVVPTSLVEEGCYAFYNVSGSGQVLDVPDASKSGGVALQTYGFNDTVAQKWLVSSAGNGWFEITNVGSGLVLDVRDGSAVAGTVVQQYESNHSDAQLWKFSVAPGGGVEVSSKLGELSLAVSGTAVTGSPVIVAGGEAGDSARWVLEPVSYIEKADDIWGDSAYVGRMREKAAKWGNSTQRPTDNGPSTGQVTGWCCTVDLDAARVCVFREQAGTWNLVSSYNAYVGGYNDKRGSKSNTFSGVWSLRHKSRALWDEAWGGINCNDWFSCFVEAWSPVPTTYANRYFEGKGYDDGQGFHYVSYNDGYWHRTQGCIGLTYEESKWIYDNVPLETPVVVFASYDNGAY